MENGQLQDKVKYLEWAQLAAGITSDNPEVRVSIAVISIFYNNAIYLTLKFEKALT